MKEIRKRAALANIPLVIDMIDQMLEEAGCPQMVQIAIDIAIDELFSNICHYAYGGDDQGEATFQIDFEAEPKAVRICFIDSGIPYNPLEKPDPDITLPAEERPIGGLGIYIVKNSMDQVSYEYKDGKNHLTIYKQFDEMTSY